MAKTTAVTPVDATPSSIYTDDMHVSDAVIEKEVTLGDGSKRTMYFKEINAIEFKQHIAAEQSKDPKVRDQSAARLIAKCLVEPDGRRAMSVARAATLKPTVAGAMMVAIMEINGVLPGRAKAAAEVDDEGADADEGDIQDEDAGN